MDYKLKDHHESSRSKQSTRVKRKPMKIVYISNPVMVKARNSSEFRTLVQQLTGQDSDIINSPTITTHEVANIETPKTTMIDRIIVDENFMKTIASIGLTEDFFFNEMFDSFAEFQSPYINV